jgi:hypothetical protein
MWEEGEEEEHISPMVRVGAGADTAQSLAAQRIWCRPVAVVAAAVQLPVPLPGAQGVEAAALPAQIITAVMAMAAAAALHQAEEPGEAVPIVLDMQVVRTRAVQATTEPAIQVEPQVLMAAARAVTVGVAAAVAGTAAGEVGAIRAAAAALEVEEGVTW